ncbi:MAG: hypothetical protein EZS28_043230, partial [Streblomastix strix]
MWYSDELEIYIRSGSYHIPRITVSGIAKTTESGIYTEIQLRTSSMSFSFSTYYDINTPSDYSDISQIPYRYEDNDMIIEFTDVETTIFEKKEMILHQKPLDESPAGLILQPYATLTSLDGTRTISKDYNHIVINGEEMFYRFQLNWDFSFICIVYSNSRNEDGSYISLENPFYYHDLVATGHVEVDNNLILEPSNT